MSESQESSQGLPMSVADLQSSSFGKTERRFIKQNRPYTAEYYSGEGGIVGNIMYYGKAAQLQGFRFDTNGELNGVVVEKRLLERSPTSGDDGGQLFDEQSNKKISSAADDCVSPVYRLVLERQPDGKFVISQRITTGDLPNWTKEYTNFNRQKK